MKLPRVILAALLLAHIGLGLLFNVSTPIFEAPDEDGHYLFVRYLQLNQALPVQRLDPNGPRAHHPPLYHLLAALLTAWVPVRGGAERIDMQPNPKVYFRYDDPQVDNKNMWVHYGPEERWPYSGQALVLHLSRALSLAFSALGVWLTYLAARALRPRDEVFALLATGLVALNPMLLFMSGVLQNNTTMLAAGAGMLYLLSRIVRDGRGDRPASWLLVGLVLGVSTLFQLSSLTLAAPAGVVLLYEAWRQRRWQILIFGGLAIALPVLALTGWWFWRNHQLYGDWTGNNVVHQMWCCDPIPPLRALKLFLTGLLGRFGQGLMITYPGWVYFAATLLVVAALASLVRRDRPGVERLAHTRRQATGGGTVRGAMTPRWLTPDAALWLAHGVNLAGVAGSLLLYAITVAPGLPGRYMFPAFPAMAYALALGWLRWFGPRYRAFAAAALGGLMGLAALYALFGLVIPTYRLPPTAGAAALRQMTPLDADIGDTARILGYRLSSARARPGQTLTVDLSWQPLSRTDVPYTVFVHVFVPGVGAVAQRDTYPGLGNYATTVWDLGRTFVDSYRLQLPPNAPPGQAEIVAGLYDGSTGVRLPVAGRDAGAPDEAWVHVATIQIEP